MNEHIEFYEPSPKQPMSVKKKVIISSLVVIVIAAIVMTFWLIWYNSAKQKMLRAIEAEDYQLLVELYTDNSDDFDDEVISVLSEKIDCIKNDYLSDKADPELAKNNIVILKKIKLPTIKSHIDSADEYITLMDDSKENYNKGISAYNTSNYVDAIYYFKLVPTNDQNNYQSAQDKLKESIEKYRKLQIELSEKIAKDGDLSKAIAMLSDTQDVLPDDELISKKITDYRAQIKNNEIDDILSNSKKEYDKGNYQTAISQIENAIKKYGNDERLSSKLDDYTTKYVKSIIETVDKLEAKHEYDSALDKINDALVVLPKNTDLSSKLSDVKKDKETYEYNVEKSNLLSQAKKEFDNKNYTKAISILHSSTKFANDADVKAKLAEYETYKPVSFVNYIEDGYFDSDIYTYSYINKYYEDNYNNTYSSSYSIDDGYVSVLVKDKGFTSFRGTIALPKGKTPDGWHRAAQLTISVDGEEVFKSQEVTNASKPQPFDIDITNAEVITLSWESFGGNIWKNWGYFATMFDGEFQK